MDIINDSNIIFAFRDWAFGLGRFLCRLWRSHRVRGASVALALVVVLGVVDYECYLAGSGRPPEEYPPLSLGEHQRVVVFAPHCDDEVLGAGGLIQGALGRGLEVQVVIVTNGDGHPFAVVDETRYLVPARADFVAMGKRRQQESLDALSRLGLGSDAVTFMGYPDVGLSSLWWNHWSAERPFRSPLSGLDRSPYDRTFHPGAPYAGEALLDDLRAVLTAGRPDLILAPHPNDAHADHRALSAFVALAVAMEQEQDPTWSPTLLGYLVHYGLYPYPRGLKLQQSLNPPRQLDAIGEWLQWGLSAEEELAKRDAVEAYRSQVRWSREYLYSFVRQNELFMCVDAAEVLGVVEVEVFPDVDGDPATLGDAKLSGHSDPVRDGVVRIARGGADIAGLRVFRWGDNLWVILELRAPASRAYGYHLYVRTFSPESTETWEGRYGRANADDVWARGDSVWFRLDREALGDPDWLAVAAETRQGVVLDRTAWHLIRLQEWPWEEAGADEQK